MKVGTVKLSQVGQYNRMDAGFHLAINDIAAELPEIKNAISPEEAKAQLKNLSLMALEPLKVLGRGSMPSSLNRDQADRIIEEYPYEAWLLVRNQAHKAREQLAKQEEGIRAQREALAKFI